MIEVGHITDESIQSKLTIDEFGLFVEKPRTNADRIRAMTDEELADEILRWFNWLNAVEWDDNRIIEWLKLPYNEKGET